jgi:hypothetical protein
VAVKWFLENEFILLYHLQIWHQQVQNTAACLISRTSRYDQITLILREIHWLPIQYRAQYKILTYTYKALHGECPIYIKHLLQVYRPTRNLRSTQQSVTLVVPKSRTVTNGDRCFTSTAPKLWNALPEHVRECKTQCAFKKSLKTHIFHQVFSD